MPRARPRELRLPGASRRPRVPTPTPTEDSEPGRVTPATTPSWPTGWPGSRGRPTSGPARPNSESYTKILIAYWHKRGVNPTSDLVTTSGSGIDPDITPADARAEIPMVSRATGLSGSVLTHLINQQTQGAELGFLGSPYIDVLQLNEALVKLEK